MKTSWSETGMAWLRQCGTLIPYIVGAFVVTSILQVAVFQDVIIRSAKLQQELQGKDDKLKCDLSPIAPNLTYWEKDTLLNVTNFRWIMNNESTCNISPSQLENGATRVVIAIVHTARSHFVERQAIRRSWGRLPLYKGWSLRFAFLLGEPDPKKDSPADLEKLKEQRTLLMKEQHLHGDLVIGSFIDSYHNLTYKHMMGYKWVLNYCPEAEFVLKVDDDMFIDVMRWLDWRTQDMKSDKAPELYGFNFGGGNAIRDEGSKWYISKEEWPESNYPAYCSGWGYGITVPLLKKLYLATQKVNFVWIDDVYATGALLREVKKEEPNVNVKYLGGKVSGQVNDYRPMCKEKAFQKKRKFKSVTYVERSSRFSDEMKCMWKKTLHDTRYKFDPSVMDSLRN